MGIARYDKHIDEKITFYIVQYIFNTYVAAQFQIDNNDN